MRRCVRYQSVLSSDNCTSKRIWLTRAMKEIDDWTKPQEQMSRERRLSSPASPWLQSLQPASHPRLLPFLSHTKTMLLCTESNYWQILVQEGLSTKFCWTIQNRQRTAKCLLNLTQQCLWKIHKRARGHIVSIKIQPAIVKSVKLEAIGPWEFDPCLPGPRQLQNPGTRPTVILSTNIFYRKDTVTRSYIYPL